MKENIEAIGAAYEKFMKDASAQCEKSNRAAGLRARKAALELTKLLKDFRKVSIEAAK